mmetsp:Transcript_2526/g.5878  ORF Transcript_2526/g.5878 Transcript_2526/m.5878 type:complete len:202 (-) Transcript_2526:769-1374(-)
MSPVLSFASRSSSALVSTKTFIFFFRSSFNSRSSARAVSACFTLSTAFALSFSIVASNFARALVMASSSPIVRSRSSFSFSLSASNLPAVVDLLASFFFASFNRFESSTSFRSASSLTSLSFSISISSRDFSDTTMTRLACAFSRSSSIVPYVAKRSSYCFSFTRNLRTSESDSALRFISDCRRDCTSTRRASDWAESSFS